MNTKRTVKILKFTLVELLMAMAVFSIIALIMMRFFSSAQQIWNKASQRSEVYADARIAMNLITRDLQCALYNNSNSTSGIYPFWFQKIKTINTMNAYYTDNYTEWTALNFIAATSVKPNGAASNVCELRYTFVPMGETFQNNSAAAAMDGGWLIRSCTGDNAPNNKYNFALIPAVSADNSRLNRIWINKNSAATIPDLPTPGGSGSWTSTGNTSFEDFQQVIPHVYNLKFTCYYYYPGENAYDSTVSYSAEDWVGTAGNFYISLVDNNLNYPTTDPSKWLSVVNYVSTAAYPVNTRVSYAGKIYISIQNVPAAPPTPVRTPPDSSPDYWQLYLCAFSPTINSDRWGTYFPVAVRIDISMMAQSDWDRWRIALEAIPPNPDAAKHIKQQYMRTFSRTVFLNSY